MKRLATLALLLAFIPIQAEALDTNDLLALVAMPLAVSAVADIADIPAGELANLVATLNNANVAPVRVIEVLRYAPVALVADDREFVQFVRTEFSQGTTGDALVTVIANRLRGYDVDPQIGTAPSRVVYVDEQFVPPLVTRRIAERRSHPHGGPPGQLKKEIGVQTGAEIVHGAAGKPRRSGPDIRVKPEGNQGQGRGQGQGQGQGGGKGKGKGKGKD